SALGAAGGPERARGGFPVGVVETTEEMSGSTSRHLDDGPAVWLVVPEAQGGLGGVEHERRGRRLHVDLCYSVRIPVDVLDVDPRVAPPSRVECRSDGQQSRQGIRGMIQQVLARLQQQDIVSSRATLRLVGGEEQQAAVEDL